VSDSARALGTSLMSLVSARMELLTLELKEEAERRKREAMLVLVAAVFLNCALILAGMFVAALFWDSQRLLATLGVTLVYLLVGGVALLRFRALERDRPAPFSATLEEFRKDLEMIRGTHERD